MENKIVNIFMKEIQDIRFENIEDLYKNRNELREKYQKLDKDYKEMYKWYFFYQLCIVRTLEIKRVLWYYLNSDGNDLGLNKSIIEEYNKFKQTKNNIIKLNNYKQEKLPI